MKTQRIKKILQEILEEDDAPRDITASLTPNRRVKAVVRANNSGILAGVEEIHLLCELAHITITKTLSDGDHISEGEIVFELEGMSQTILSTERSLLNLLSLMSGVATLTHHYVELAHKVNPNVRIAATRKTLPLLRYFQKKAVKIGGGDPHRKSLADAVLIKDNHLKLFKGVREAIRIAKENVSFTHKIEIEVNTISQAIEAAEEGADIIMLDNMSPEQIKETINELKKRNLRDRVILEASGGVTEENIQDYASSGVDVISLGVITHSAPSLDFSLTIQPK